MQSNNTSPVMQTLSLSWRLFRDKGVSWQLKLLPFGAVLYYFSPLDIAPELLPALGVTDDLGLILLSFHWFIKSAPAEVVKHHMKELGFIQIQPSGNEDNSEKLGSSSEKIS